MWIPEDFLLFTLQPAAAKLLARLMPQKTWFSASAVEVEYRQMQLESYLQAAFKDAKLRASDKLRSFVAPHWAEAADAETGYRHGGELLVQRR